MFAGLVLPDMPNKQLLLAIEIEIAVLLESFFEQIPSKKRRRALLRRLKRNTRKHVKDGAKIGAEGRAASKVAARRLKAHAKALRIIGD